MALTDKPVLTIPEVAEVLNISERAAYGVLRSGKLGDPATMRVAGPRSTRVPTANVLAYIARLGAQPAGESA